jgi:hypothetical protein
MTNIKVQDLAFNGISETDSFNDSESFMKELTETELLATNGGSAFVVMAFVTVAVFCFTAGFMQTSQNCKQ